MRKVVEVSAFGVVELQRAGERFEHLLADAADVAALQAPVVLDADTGQRRDLLAPQPLHAAGAVGGQPDLFRHDVRTA
jgi:transcriptional regulator of aromatic amino acid metabolism